MEKIESYYSNLSKRQGFDFYKNIAYEMSDNDRHLECDFFINLALKEKQDANLLKLKAFNKLRMGDFRTSINDSKKLRALGLEEPSHIVEVAILFALGKEAQCIDHMIKYIKIHGLKSPNANAIAHDIVARFESIEIAKLVIENQKPKICFSKLGKKKFLKIYRHAFVEVLLKKINKDC